MKGVIEISKYSNTVEYNLRTKVDTSGVIQLQRQFAALNTEIAKLSSQKLIDDKQIAQARNAIDKIQTALSSSFNSTLGVFDLSRFQKSLDGLSLGNLQQTLSSIPNGTKAFNNMLGTIGQIDTQFKSISSTTDKIFNTFGNTVRWGITASIFQSIQNDLYRAVEYVQELDTSLNNIRIVSGQSAQQMRDFSLYANQAAQNLGQTTTAFTDAALIFIQQGLDAETSNYLADLTLRMANVTQQDTATASEQITSIMNGYNMSLEETSRAIDTLANVAAQGASDMEELATAESRVAATASTLGVTQEQLAAQISTIISVTRQAPETVGNALRSIYSRMADLKLGETLEDGVDLGRFSGVVESVGVQVLDTSGNLRNMGDIIEDLMVRWQDLSSAQQISVGTTLAGRYQLNPFLTLMSNMEMYNQQLEVATDSAGVLDEQQAIYMDSMAAKLNQLTAASEGFISTLFNPDDWKPGIEMATDFIQLLTDMVESIGGLTPLLTGLGAVLTRVFSNNISAGITNILQNRAGQKISANNEQVMREMLSTGATSAMGNLDDNKLYSMLSNSVDVRGVMTSDQQGQFNEAVKNLTELENQYQDAVLQTTAAEEAYNKVLLEQNELLKQKGVELKNSKDVDQKATAQELRDTAKTYEEMGHALNLAHEEMGKRLSGEKGSSNKTIETIYEDLVGQLGTNLGGNIGQSGAINKAYAEYLNAAKSGTSDLSKETERLMSLIEKLGESYYDTANKAKEGLNALKQREEALKSQGAKVSEAQQNQKNAGTLRDRTAANIQEYMIEPLEAQAVRTTILNMAGAVGELAFAWQSFQNLGSIFVDEDLSTGEKFQQVLMNLAFVLPSLINGFQTFEKTLKILNVLQQGDSLLSMVGAIKTAEGAVGKFSAGLNLAGSAIGKFRAGILQLVYSLGPMQLILMAVGAAFTLFQAEAAKAEQAAQNIKDAATEAQSSYDSIVSAQSQFETVYDSYKEGAATVDELKEAAEALNSVMGDQTLAAQSAAGQWDAYAASVEAATQAEAKKNYQAQVRAMDQYMKEYRGGFMDENTEYTPIIGTNSVNRANLFDSLDAMNEVTSFSQYGFGSRAGEFAFTPDADIATAIQDFDRMEEAYSEAIEEAQRLADEAAEGSTEYAMYTSQLTGLQRELTNLQNLRATRAEEEAAFTEAQQSAMSSYLLSGEDADELAYKTGESIDEYRSRITPVLENAGFTVTDDLFDSFMAGIDSADIANKDELIAQNSREIAEDNFREQFSDKLQQEPDFVDNSSLVQQLAKQGIDTQKYGEQINDLLIDSIIQQVNNSSLTEEQQAELLSNIDWTDPIENILGNVAKSIENGSVDYISASNVEDDSSERQATLTEFDISDETFDSYKELVETESALAETNQEVTDSIEKAKQEFGENSEEVKNLQKGYEDIDDISDDLATDLIRTQKGVDKLSESFEENYDILSRGDKTSLEYAEALAETKDALADVLNVSSEDISNDFIANHLEDIQSLVNGDVEALDRLRIAAGQEYVLELNQTGNLSDESLNYLQQKITEIGGMQIEVGASINDQAFVDSLNNMLLNGELTKDQVNTMLNMIGVEPNFTTVPHETTLFSTEGMSVSGELFGIPYDFDLPPFSITGMVDVPQITPAEGSGGTGLYKKATSYNGGRGFSAPKSSGGGSGGGGRKGGGGGGGGSGKSYEPKTKDPVEDELDRYERVDTELDALGNDFEKIADEQDRLLGDDLAKNMTKQIELLKEQIYWQQQKLEIQKEEAAEYRNQLSSQYGVTFNDEGFITNYADRYKAYLNNLNNLINQYNSTTTEAGQEALDKQIEDAQEAFDKFNELIDNYDDLISNQIKDSEAQIESFYDQIEDLQIEAFNRVVETVDNIKEIQETLVDFNAVFSGLDSDSPFREMATSLEKLKKYWDVGKESMEDYYDSLIAKNNEALKRTDLSEAQRNWLQYQNEVLQEGKAAYGQGTLEAGGTGYLDMELSNLNTIIGQIAQFEQQGFASIFGENESALFETAKEIFDSATSMIEDYEGEVDNLRDAILDAIDEIGERIDDRLEQYQNINDELEHYGSLIEMLHGKNAYDELNQALSAQVNNNQSQILVIKESIEILKDMQSAMEEGSEEWKAVQEQINDKQSELLDKTEETMEQLVEIYENGVNKALDAWTADSPLGSDLDWVSDEWELINRNADYYLDDVNAAYNIQKLQGKYLELLDGTDDLFIQQQITNQMNQQLQYLREKNNLSQYDVDYANAQLEILQRTIALQEAQRNKSQLQLRRDTQGNYNYVYTANEGDIASAQGDLLDAQNNAYNLSKDQIKQTQDDSLSALQDAKNMLSDLWTDANLTLEEKTKRTQTIIDSLKEYLAGTGEQLSTAETNIINDFIGMCELLTDENRTNLEDVYNEILQGNNDAFDQIDTRWSTSLTQWLQNLTDFNDKTDEAFDNLVSNYESYQESLDELSEAAGTNFDDLTSHINNANDATAALNQTSQDFMTTIRDDAGVIKSYENQLAEMTAKIQDADNAMKAYQEQVNDLAGKLTAKEQENANLSNRVQELEQTVKNYEQYGNANGTGGSGGGSGGAKGDSATAWGIAQAIWTYGSRSGWGNDPIRSGKLTKAFGSAFARQVQQIINQNTRNGKLVNYDSMKYSSYNLIGYDTGGYTGNFNDPSGAGRLAILHSKELVLNESDTKNILQAVEAVRNLTTNFRNGAFENAVEALSNYGSEMLMSSVEPQDLEQNVHIEANFPNVVGAEEIERALLNLTNTAMQYANRNGRNPVNSNGSFS